MNETDLLAEFRATRAEGAFSELVRRYTNLVYSIARRRVADVTLAQEVSQIVFIRLAKAPPKLMSEGQLLAWLHRTTVHASIDLWRSETRRRAREQHAVAMQNNPAEEFAWNELSPVLDEALNELDDSDRQVLLLRFFEQKTMADLGRMLDVNEDAAKMRVSRALGRLRTRLSSLGGACSAALLGTLLYERSVEAAPVGLAATLAAIRIGAPAGLASSLIIVFTGATGSKLVQVVAAAIVITATALLLLHKVRRNTNPEPRGLAQSGLSNASLAEANSDTNSIGGDGDPDPVKLLQAVARARRRITSGIVEFDIIRYGNNVGVADATNESHLKIQFEEGRIWSESSGQRYGYNSEEAKKRADEMPLAQAIHEGLVGPFMQHYLAFCDGEFEVDYWESGTGSQTTIIKPGYSGVNLFDPRCLGLEYGSKPFETIETCLGYKDAKAVALIGQEIIEGNLAWHVQVKDKYDDIRDFWIDVLHSTRVLKAQQRGDVCLSRYSDSDLKDPIPTEIRHMDIVSVVGVVGFRWDYTRRQTEYNVSINPVCWTLDGLHMKIGTAVRDDRKHRQIGYWNGTGLSGVRPKEQLHQPPVNRAELLTLLDSESASPAGFGAALWILTNSPDGADVQKVGDMIAKLHAQRPEMERLVRDLDRMRPTCSTNILPAIIDQNPDINVRGNACMVLATYLKDIGENEKNRPVVDEAEKYYERVIAEFGQVPGENGGLLAEFAEPQLSDLRRLSIGKLAPDIDGCDLYGNRLNLSDYRGKIVTLIFGDDMSKDSIQAFNSLVDQMDGKPFVLLGIRAGDDYEKANAAEKSAARWSSFHDPREGAIRKSYNVGSEWRTIYVLDRKGVIRDRGLRYPQEVTRAVEKLLKEEQ
jgi:RNA polymerase sigma factor (sigma-70 family)